MEQFFVFPRRLAWWGDKVFSFEKKKIFFWFNQKKLNQDFFFFDSYALTNYIENL